MAVKIYVGNLSYNTDEDGLQELFTKYGTVEKVNIITDRDSGRSKGFGFVEMAEEEQAKEAIDKLNGYEFGGRQLKVSEARERPNNRQGGNRRFEGGGRREGGQYGGKRRY
ncbi:MAG TPA: RNA-binding protein [Candidatus Eremiobacteraeota bacterium]|nr:MAG: RNA recognition motif [bacterium ADurb.Bin363]HPZ06681.1 RNA-binding protein [Candidatus Eremiobacteraeota bacterium]